MGNLWNHDHKVRRANYQEGGRGANLHFTPDVKTFLSSALTLLCSEDNVPALIVCNLGKDRTGALSPIVEALCEVPEDTIAQDYSLSKVCWNYRHLLNKSVSVSIYYAMSQFQYLLMQTIPHPHPQYNVVFDFYQYIEHETGLIS